jgi:hypothetical protein
VTLHGFVSEEDKARLYDRAWVSLTASSAEGWCLTVMEAADRGTPSAALAVGGLPESIVDGQTGVLADTPQELAAAVGDLVAQPERRRALGEAARARARGFTWDATARANLTVLERTAAAGRQGVREVLAGSDTGTAAGLAGATLLNNLIQLAFTVAITRVLGVDGYGALAALVSAFLVLLVGGQSVQAAAAARPRSAASAATLSCGRRSGAGRSRSSRSPRAPRRSAWACATRSRRSSAWRSTPGPPPPCLPTGGLWLPALPPARRAAGPARLPPRGAVARRGGRDRGSCSGSRSGWPGAGVTGVFLATRCASWPRASGSASVLARRLGPAAAPAEGRGRSLRSLATEGWVPIVGLLLLAVLQNVDVIIARTSSGTSGRGPTRWPRWRRRSSSGWRSASACSSSRRPRRARPAARTRAPSSSARSRPRRHRRAVAAHLRARARARPAHGLRARDGRRRRGAARARPGDDAAGGRLPDRQYMVALGEMRFLWVLAVVAVAEVLLLFGGSPSITGFAAVVLGAQVIAAGAVLALGLRARPAAPAR